MRVSTEMFCDLPRSLLCGPPCSLLCALLCIAPLAGCSASLQQLEERNQTDMRSVYAQVLGGDSQRSVPLRTESRDFLYPQQLYPLRKLPNPALLMWIHAHFAGDNEAPVPGYMTSFFLYPRDHFALPGEWAPP